MREGSCLAKKYIPDQPPQWACKNLQGTLPVYLYRRFPTEPTNILIYVGICLPTSECPKQISKDDSNEWETNIKARLIKECSCHSELVIVGTV